MMMNLRMYQILGLLSHADVNGAVAVLELEKTDSWSWVFAEPKSVAEVGVHVMDVEGSPMDSVR
jgi:hypothetical protein